ncbi:MAG: extracellular solute-binding protein [Micrococcales bacterium]|nr:extracellular solute-binding protein [Micrococcales bacterium]
MRFTRTVATALAVAGALSLAACSGGSPTTSASAGPSGSSGANTGSLGAGTASSGFSTALPPSDTSATINIWTYLTPEQSGWFKTGEDLLAKEFPNVKVNVTYVPYDQITAKLLGTAASGGGPDGVIFDPTQAIALEQAGVLGDMSPFWNEFSDASQFPDFAVWKDGDKVISVQGYANTTGLFYNKDLLDSLGLQPPTTVSQLGDDLKQIHAAGKQGLAISAVPTSESEFQIMTWMFGEGQNYGSFTQDKVASVFSTLQGWVNAGYIPKDAVGWGATDALTAFSNGQYAFTQNGNWNIALMKKVPFNWGVVAMPAGSAGSHSVPGGEGACIGAKTKNAALVWEFFKDSMLTKASQIGILNELGSIPVRKDAASDPAISSDPVLSTFANIVANSMARPNDPNTGTDEVTMGKIWNSVAGGVVTPDQGAQQVVSQLNNVG